jgi:hypothetical protein
MEKKTLEELRAKNAERQRRWRAANLGLARLKERNARRQRREAKERRTITNGGTNHNEKEDNPGVEVELVM